MSPELEKVLEAIYERDHEDCNDRAYWNRIIQHLLEEALKDHPAASRDALLQAIMARYLEFRRARRQPPTIPPSA